MKFCKDCKYLHKVDYSDYCNNPKNGLNLVTADTKLRLANMNRGASLLYSRRNCGEDAEWFEPKEVKMNWMHRLMFWRKD